MNSIELESYDWVCRLLAFEYIEIKLGKKLKDEDNKLVHDMKKMCVENMKECYERMKSSNDKFDSNLIYQLFEKIKTERETPLNVKKAKELLESEGYKIIKG